MSPPVAPSPAAQAALSRLQEPPPRCFTPPLTACSPFFQASPPVASAGLSLEASAARFRFCYSRRCFCSADGSLRIRPPHSSVAAKAPPPAVDFVVWQWGRGSAGRRAPSPRCWLFPLRLRSQRTDCVGPRGQPGPDSTWSRLQETHGAGSRVSGFKRQEGTW